MARRTGPLSRASTGVMFDVISLQRKSSLTVVGLRRRNRSRQKRSVPD